MRDLTAAELRDLGYLQEVNRQFFHPLGLAMHVDVETGEMGVYDDREDPEGWYFGPSPDEDPVTWLDVKAALIEEQRTLRGPARLAALGYWVQPLPEREA